MNAKITVFVICVEAIMYLLLHNLHDCTFKDVAVHNSLVRSNFYGHYQLFCISSLLKSFGLLSIFFVLEHLSVVLSHLFLHRCVPLRYFTWSL